MAKALVIKSVDFSENKLTTVELDDAIACTGIELDESAILATSFAPIMLTATVSPADCTEQVTWSTDDPNIATVNSGVVTPAGLGTVTITATCGEYSATCEITVDNVVISTGWDFGSLYSYGSNDFTTAYYPSNYKSFVYADKIPLDSARLRFARNSSFVGDFNLTAVALPYGAGRLKLESTNVSGVYYVLFFDSTQNATDQSVVIKQVTKNTPSAPSSGVVSNTFTITDGDSFGISVTMKTQYESTDNPDTIANTLGLKFTLMTAAEDEET